MEIAGEEGDSTGLGSRFDAVRSSQQLTDLLQELGRRERLLKKRSFPIQAEGAGRARGVAITTASASWRAAHAEPQRLIWPLRSAGNSFTAGSKACTVARCSASQRQSSMAAERRSVFVPGL